ncbi:MAG: HdeD family acid-resistance protein [Mizugakiibacter sp.]|uniref:HdeD family acid-resistance protein n=1 Tax=Mizugakiibacter sp. TaxID=1972610 RepID=UPI0031C75B15|nr:HdeD family acid-resistance protein [Xanthomonadaceae bacterium]
MALGVVLLVLAVVAGMNLYAATVASVYMVGILMLVGALAQIAHAFQVRHWGGVVAWLLAGLLYGAAGIFAFANPLLAAATLTLLLAFALIASGIMRAWWSTSLRPLRGWGWIAASGVISAVVGVVFIAGWPQNTLWLLGMILVLDLAFQGATAIAFGLALRRLGAESGHATL